MAVVVRCPVCKVGKVSVTLSKEGPRPICYALEGFDPAECECSESPLVDLHEYRDALVDATLDASDD